MRTPSGSLTCSFYGLWESRLLICPPAGPFLGESVKIWAVSKSISAKFGVTSVVIEDLLYSIGTTLFVLSGFLILLVSTVHKHNFVMPDGVIILLALAMIVFAIIVQQSHLLGRLCRRI